MRFSFTSNAISSKPRVVYVELSNCIKIVIIGAWTAEIRSHYCRYQIRTAINAKHLNHNSEYIYLWNIYHYRAVENENIVKDLMLNHFPTKYLDLFSMLLDLEVPWDLGHNVEAQNSSKSCQLCLKLWVIKVKPCDHLLAHIFTLRFSIESSSPPASHASPALRTDGSTAHSISKTTRLSFCTKIYCSLGGYWV